MGWLIRLLMVIGIAAQAMAAGGEPPRVSPWSRHADTLFRVIAGETQLNTVDVPRAVAQDGEGFIWIATDGGLVRWDGHVFRMFNSEPEKPGGLPEGILTTAHADSAGRLWVGMVSEGLRRFDPETETFVMPINRTVLDHAAINAIGDDGEGGLWVASRRGLAHIDAEGHVLMMPAAAGLPDGDIKSVAVDRARTLWVTIGGTLYRRAQGATRFSVVAVPVRKIAPGKLVGAKLLVDSRDRLWMSSTAGMLTVIDSRGTRAVTLPGAAGEDAPLLSGMVEARPGVLWIASDQGIFVVDMQTMASRRVHHDPAFHRSLPDDDVHDIFRDRAGMLWVLSDQSITRVNGAATGIATLAGMLGANARGEPIDPRSVAADPTGRLWVGSKSDGGYILDLAVGRAMPMTAAADLGVAPASLRIRAMAFAGGHAYLGTDTGLFIADRTGRIIRRLSYNPVERMQMDGGRLLAVQQHGVHSLDITNPDARLVQAIAPAQLGDHQVRAIAVAPDGALWFGTVSGLYRIDRNSGASFGLFRRQRGSGGLSANFISTLAFDAKGRLWVGTGGGGLDVLDRQADGWKVVRRFNRANGLPHNTVDSIVRATDGTMWVSTDAGIVRIDPGTFAMNVLGEADGLAFLQNWTAVGTRTPEGDIVFGSVGGLTVIDPAVAARPVPTAPVAITMIRIDGRPVHARDLARPLSVPSSARAIAIDFAALDYAAPERIAYSYRLKGFGDAWTRVDADHRSVSFTNLAPGRYVFEIRSTDRHGEWRGESLALPITVVPEWYETWWFRALMAIAVVALIVGALRLLTMTLRNRKNALEKLVATRTEELRRSQRELERLVYFDPLTGLGNRRMFSENLSRLIARGPRGPGFSLILVDLDRFKSINDRLGHDAGDAMLSETGARLLRVVRETDSVARLGGDEFALLVPGVIDETAIAQLCDRIVDLFDEPVDFADQMMRTSPSLGVAVFPAHGLDSERLYKAADLALYAAKRGGRNTWRLSTADDLKASS